MSNVPVLQAVRAANAFRQLHWRQVAPVLGIVAVTDALVQALSLMRMASGLWAIFNIVAVIAAYGALLRLAFADEHAGDADFTPGKGGLQFKRPELRLMAMGMLLGALIILLGLVVAFAGSLLLVTTGFISPEAAKAAGAAEGNWAALSPDAQRGIGILGAMAIAAVVYVAVRLSLAPAATVARKQILIFQTWALTRGQFWRILAATAIVSIPTIVVMAAIWFGLDALTTGDAPASAPVAFIAGALHGLVGGFVAVPLNIGLSAFLYRGLRPAHEARSVSG